MFLHCLKMSYLIINFFKKNIRSKAGKGLILSISSLLYGILRALDIISKPIYVLDIFMLIILLYSIYLIKFKSID